MCISTKRFIVVCTVCFGIGVFLSFVLPPYFLAFVEAAAIVLTGLLLLDNKR